jgi:uncharacterized protein YdeI (YjbR/CyaY-like superfamily)
MPDEVRQALHDRGLEDAYAARPPFQRNDYIGWITGAVRSETRQKRLQQMLDELAAGHGYMNMRWQPRDKS